MVRTRTGKSRSAFPKIFSTKPNARFMYLNSLNVGRYENEDEIELEPGQHASISTGADLAQLLQEQQHSFAATSYYSRLVLETKTALEDRVKGHILNSLNTFRSLHYLACWVLPSTGSKIHPKLISEASLCCLGSARLLNLCRQYLEDEATQFLPESILEDAEQVNPSSKIYAS